MAKKDVAAILAKRVRESRSPLYQWLHENYDQIAPIITAQSRPAWEALAKTVADSSNLPRPSRQGVKKAWMRLVQDKERAPDRPPAQKRLNALAVQTEVTPAPTEPTGRVIEPDAPKSAPRRNFTVSTPKKEI